jgi:Glycosyl transferase family 2
MLRHDLTAVITSCGRQDLLAITIKSFLRFNTHPCKILIVEDGELVVNEVLMRQWRPPTFEWLSTGRRVGQIAAVDFAYSRIDTPYIFHCEDDWEFYNPGFIEKSLCILEERPDVLQVWLRSLNDTNGHPIRDGVYRLNDSQYRLMAYNYRRPSGTIWHGFSFNPGLRRLSDYRLLGSFSRLDPECKKSSGGVERDASVFYQQKGYVAAILCDREGQGYVRHIGSDRRVKPLGGGVS